MKRGKWKDKGRVQARVSVPSNTPPHRKRVCGRCGQHTDPLTTTAWIHTGWIGIWWYITHFCCPVGRSPWRMVWLIVHKWVHWATDTWCSSARGAWRDVRAFLPFLYLDVETQLRSQVTKLQCGLCLVRWEFFFGTFTPASTVPESQPQSPPRPVSKKPIHRAPWPPPTQVTNRPG